MKKLILNLIRKRGYQLVANDRLKDFYQKEVNLEKAVKEIYLILQRSDFDALPLGEVLTQNIVSRVSNLIGTNPYEGLSIANAFMKVIDIKGDICEFGVAQGKTSALLATLISKTDSSKKLFLIDSFKGLSKPTEKDKLLDDIFNLGSMEAYEGSMSFAKSVVCNEVLKTGLDRKNFELVEGYMEKIIKKDVLPKTVSLAYVDFDLYAPIKDALDYLDRVTEPSAVIIVDDYDFFSAGAKIAVDEFLEKHPFYSINVPDKELGHFCVLTKISK